MVFGNLDERSGTGVLFTRNPLTGDPSRYGEWLPRGQGEDVVSGRLDAASRWSARRAPTPEVHAQLMDAASALEREGRDVQDIEFTVERGRLWLLQTRAAKRSAVAAVRSRVSLAREGSDRARRGARAGDAGADRRAARAAHRRRRPAPRAALLATRRAGLSRGRASGSWWRSTDEAEDWPPTARRRPRAADDRSRRRPRDDRRRRAIVTEIGGATVHAAVVSRELGRPCVVGCGAGTVDSSTGRQVTVDGDDRRDLRRHPAAGGHQRGRLPRPRARGRLGPRAGAAGRRHAAGDPGRGAGGLVTDVDAGGMANATIIERL